MLKEQWNATNERLKKLGYQQLSLDDQLVVVKKNMDLFMTEKRLCDPATMIVSTKMVFDENKIDLAAAYQVLAKNKRI